MSPTRIPDRPWPFLLKYIGARRWQFAGLALLVTGAGSCAVAVQYGMKMIVDAMVAADRLAAAVWQPLLLFLSLIALENVLWRCSGWLGCRAIVATGADIRVDLFEHLIGHPMRYFTKHMAGSLSSRITATAGSTGAILSRLTWNIAPPAVDFLGAVVVLSLVDYRMAMALIAFVAVVAAIITSFGVRGRSLHRAYGKQAASVGGELVDTVSNVWTIKAFSARARERARLEGAIGVEAMAQRKSWMYLEKARVIHDFFLWIMAGTMLTWAIQAWRLEAISPGDVVLVSALTFRILHGSRDLALALVEMSQEYGVIAEMLEVIGERHSFSDSPGALPIRPREGRIEFHDVSFHYPDGHAVFKHLNLAIPPGQKLGLAGPSGGGKSTLLALIQRLDEPQHGQIRIDGTPINEMAQDCLREGIAVVPQDISLFRRSIMENIRYSRPDASDEEVHVAARYALCDGFIRQMRHGYDTVIGERGATLSGGQRQRLAIARAFLKDAPVLLLDEATSALDTRSERAVQQALSDLIQGRTVIAVAHRLSTLSGFDRIVMLAAGRIVEDGSPHELLEHPGMFSSLWQAQSGSQRASA
ncbi:ABC transporter ATP-binding protein [Pollutimonas sp. M17]|uniref:ABC transporter ATP-binding protein n=1 Tax=Pollutimonas sp. M17 TaxID=2962065 RepID=UPI0021F43752|nr:ABC transporter ATP-binding protein [Pollutimonas sp. M17]UYO94161.1 ABC transporter ATP-binding protein/permease [Pollutimonas sp. M17]